MPIIKLSLLDGASAARGLAVIIDVFRAFTTACYVADASPREYLLVRDSGTAARLAATAGRPFLIGKPELGAALAYNVPNSPTLILAHQLAGRTVIHRTGAGARGILRATDADEVIAASLVNADAVARYIRTRKSEVVTLVCMGHEGATPSAEDELCAEYIAARLHGRSFDLWTKVQALRDGPGRYFFGLHQHEYPCDDFRRCTEADRFTFALRARRHGDYAELVRVDV